jgi:hypothetical protein
MFRHYEEVELFIWHRIASGQAYICFVIKVGLMHGDASSGVISVFVQRVAQRNTLTTIIEVTED